MGAILGWERVDGIVRQIEDAFVAHWSLLGRWPGARLLAGDGVVRFETPMRKLPYNGVIRTAIGQDAERVVARVADAYAERGSEFFWLVHPSAAPADLADRLADAGLTAVERATGMSLELDGWDDAAADTGATFAEVVDDSGRRAYEEIMMTYWELDERDRADVLRLSRWFGSLATGRPWLAFLDGEAVGKGYLSLAGPPGVAAIYGMSVRPEARGRGIAGALTATLVRRAKELGCRRIVLHASDMAAGVYRRAGFVARCTLDFYATAPIWSGEQ
jgi:ribosomal protein S18 acetylase RimI-like enzyme